MTSSGGVRTVLVVDDDETIRRVLDSFLSLEGYRVLLASDGAAALDLLQREPADVILLDMRMPVMDGWEFSRRYRQGSWTAPLVAFTAGRDAAARAQEIGAQFYVGKPFEVDDLLSTLERAVQTN